MKGALGENRGPRRGRTKKLSTRKVRRGGKSADDVLERLPVGIARFGLFGRFAYVNPSLCRLLGYSRIELLALTTQEVSHDKNDDFASRLDSRTGASFQLEKRLVRKDGVGIWVALSFGSRDGLCVVEDVSARKQLEVAHRSSEERFSSLTRLSSDWYWELDTEFRFTFMQSQQLEKETDTSMIGKRRWEMGFSIEGEGGWEAHRALLKDRKPYRDVIVCRDWPDGTRRYFSLNAEPRFDSENQFTGYRGVSREITEEKRAAQRVLYIATHDELTRIPNRNLFNELLGHALKNAQRYERRFAVLFIDLDGLKRVNDTLGHEAGDRLLQAIATRLTATVRSGDTVARLGGDEFVVLLQELSEASDASLVAEKILSAVIEPIPTLDDRSLVSASIGIAIYPNDGADQQTLMKSADAAMYNAKVRGKNNFQYSSKDA